MTRLSLFTDPSRRAVLLLVIAQALSVTTNTIIITTTALTGHMLASDKSLATVPLSLQFITTMLTALPASFLMRRYGRQTGFMIGAMLVHVGSLLGAYAV